MPQSMLALLLLPDPPQRLADINDIRAALYPPLAAAVSFLNRETTPSVLEIALPISRLVHVFRKHRSFFTNVSVLLAHVYSLLASIYHQYNISLSDASSIDARVMLILDDGVDSPEQQTKLCGTTQFRALARSSRPWSHIFVVDSENGRARHRSFTLMAKEERSEWNPRTITIPGGLQFYFPNQTINAEDDSHIDPDSLLDQNALVAIESGVFDFTDKYVLTMGLLSMRQTMPLGRILQEKIMEGRSLFVATVEKDNRIDTNTQIKQQKNVVEFLRSLLDFGPRTMLATYASKVDTLDASYPLSSIEQKFCVQCFVSTYKDGRISEHIGVSTILTATSLADIAAKINETRRDRGWAELEIVKLDDIRGVELFKTHD